MKAAEYFPFRHEVRVGTLAAVQGLTADQLDWKPAGGVHSILGFLRHIAQSEDWWIQAGVHGRHDFVPRRKADLPDLAATLTYLEETRAATEEILETWPADRLQERRPVPPGFRGADRGAVLPLHWILGNLYDHERHHRAQIYLYLRLMGLEPPLY